MKFLNIILAVSSLFSRKYTFHVVEPNEPDKNAVTARLGLGGMEVYDASPKTKEPAGDKQPEGKQEDKTETDTNGQAQVPAAGEDGKYSIGDKSLTLEEVQAEIAGMDDTATVDYNGKPYTKAELAKEFKAEPAGDSTENSNTVSLAEGVEIPEEDFQALYEALEKSIGKEKFEKLDDDIKKTLLLEKHNLKVASRETNKNNQLNAAARKELEEENKRIASEREQINKLSGDIKAAGEELVKEKERYEALLKKDADKIDDDNERDDLKFEQSAARKWLKETLPSKEKELNDKVRALKEDHDLNVYFSIKNELISTFPEDFSTSKSIEDLNDIMTGKDKDAQGRLSTIDKRILRKFKSVFKDYMSEDPEYRRNNTIVDFYNDFKEDYPVIKAGVTETKPEVKKEEKPTGYRALYEELKKKQAAADGNPPGGNGSMGITGKTGTGKSKELVELETNARKSLLGNREEEL